MRNDNQELVMHALYSYAYITDSVDGLILTDVNTLEDGEARNNFFKRALTWNPDGILNGARHITIGGSNLFIVTPRGLVIVSVETPLSPKVIAQLPLNDARATALQFRYLFVTDANGLEVIDVTHPETPRLVPNDARDVVVASTNASLFAYVADGGGGLKVLQLTSPQSQPKFYGFSPEPHPQLIASYATRKPAMSVSKGLDRDRAVDETGNEIAVFGRRGSRPLSMDEMKALYLDSAGNPWFAPDDSRAAQSPVANNR